MDERMLYHSKKIVDVYDNEWDSLIDVPLLPLTTDYMPQNLEKDFRQMNPSGIEEELPKRDILESTIQRLTQNFQIVSQNGSLKVDMKNAVTMSLCDLYYQVKNRKCNLYTPKSEIIQLDKVLELNYLYYDNLVDSFTPKYTKYTLMDPTSIQNFNDDYQNEFQNRDLLNVIFPVQKYVILYTKNHMKEIEETW